MPDPQPSKAAIRLAKVMLYTALPMCDETGLVDDEQAEIVIALALDNAGVGKAVDKLERISLSLACSDLKSWSHLIDEALAALTGEKT